MTQHAGSAIEYPMGIMSLGTGMGAAEIYEIV
jgi:hypothetical protein